MWRKYFKLVGLVPGPVIVQRFGTIDFSGDVPVETCKKLYEQDFRYLEITDEGKEKLYGIKVPSVRQPADISPERGKKKKRGTSRKSGTPTKRTYKKRKASKK